MPAVATRLLQDCCIGAGTGQACRSPRRRGQYVRLTFVANAPATRRQPARRTRLPRWGPETLSFAAVSVKCSFIKNVTNSHLTMRSLRPPWRSTMMGISSPRSRAGVVSVSDRRIAAQQRRQLTLRPASPRSPGNKDSVRRIAVNRTPRVAGTHRTASRLDPVSFAPF